MRISKKSFLLILLIIYMITLSGNIPEGKSFLFEIDWHGTKSYVLGSVHMLKKDHYPLKKVITDSFDNCDNLAVEVDILNLDKFELYSRIMEMAKYDDPENLKDNIDESLYKKTETALKEFGMAMDFWNKYKPWFVAISLQGYKLVKLGYDPQLGVDLHFLKKAKQKKIDILELEGAIFQMNLLNEFTQEEQIDFLKATVNETEKLPKVINEIVDAWLGGDMDKIDGLFHDEFKEVTTGDSLKKKFIDDRNVSMTEKIISWIKTGKSYFIVVGAGHLVGEMGIISLIKKAGYQTKQL